MNETDRRMIGEIAEDVRKLFGVERKPLKRPYIGLECEFIILDSNGRVVHSADRALRKAGHAKKECAKNILEVASFRSKTFAGAMNDLLQKTESVLDILEENGESLYFCSTYPGKFSPVMRMEGGYGVKQKVFGRERFKIAGRCVGFHCHYDLPKGMFDYFTKRIKVFIKSKISRSMVGSYNMLIAMDPAFATFAQSSPYYQGRLYGKNSRMMFYRGSTIFGVNGLYSDFHDFGSLPPYTHTLLDINHVVEDRFREWTLLMKRLGVNIRAITLYGSVLDTNWSPVKINPLGTFEMRGMDMNRFQVMASLAVSMTFILKSMHDDYLSVVDSDLGVKEPFKMEGDTIYVPPFSYVYSVLQRDAAIYGMDSPAIRLYCSRLLKLSSKFVPRERKKFLKPLKVMLSKRRTLSDIIISAARKMGYKERIPNSAAAEIALRVARGMRKDIRKTRRLLPME